MPRPSFSGAGPPEGWRMQPRLGSIARVGPGQYVLRGHDRTSGQPVEVALGGGTRARTRRPRPRGNGAGAD